VTGTLHLIGGPAPDIDKAASGVMYAFTSSSLSGMPIAKVKTGSDGNFHLSLPPGTYYLEPGGVLLDGLRADPAGWRIDRRLAWPCAPRRWHRSGHRGVTLVLGLALLGYVAFLARTGADAPLRRAADHSG
jgi:hypothetical protein